jgi:hypothetical protein
LRRNAVTSLVPVSLLEMLSTSKKVVDIGLVIY